MLPTLLTLVCAAPGPEIAPALRVLTPAVLLDMTAREYERIESDFYRELRAAKSDEAVSDANAKWRDERREWAPRAWSLVRAYPSEPAAFDVLLYLNEASTEREEIVRILRQYHFANPKIGKLVNSIAQNREPELRGFADEIADKHPDRAVRGKALLDLGRLDDRIYLVDAFTERPSFNGRLGPPDILRPRAELYLTKVIRDFAEIPDSGETLGKLAEAELAGLKNVGKLELGKPAPEIVGEDLEGNSLTWSPGNGKVTVLVFWGSWCGPCMKLVPVEKKLVESYGDRPFALIGINGGDLRSKAKSAAKSKQMTWPSFFSGQQGGIAAEWNVQSWPMVYVVDETGLIRYKGDGDGLQEAVEKCLAAHDGATETPEKPNGE